MKAWVLQIDKATGNVLLTYRTETCHICVEADPDEFAEFASMVNAALGESKMAAE